MLSMLKHWAWKSVLPSWRITQFYFCAEDSNIAMIHKAPGSQQISASPADGARRVKVPCFELLQPICPLTRGRTASLSYKGKWSSLFLIGKVSFFVSGPSSFPHLIINLLRPACSYRRGGSFGPMLCLTSVFQIWKEVVDLTSSVLGLKNGAWVDFAIAGRADLV